ncbi:hypothetical protein SAMN04488030_1967 [Aliiroseovarius halocynthiae]|uniref:Uncharacterized protein n=1 Tax=Aliiroseovarius halocynthiae TaxID=985055 RepID=A0A545SRB0_9RHOB|nr:hypothetical protein [Aliiroseovarius halocynthiae]TQV67489.1 hypothetical protein FIL88_09700 [Aliiroseovarius halocynthiae]SMR81498.1 hypothetical protein SAMN04488030_1967 [Aliiroseovarius halocynthiae]
MSNYQTALSRYTDIKKFIQNYLYLEGEKKTLYFRTDPGPVFTLHFNSCRDVDAGVIAFQMAFAAKLSNVTYRCSSVGYGTFKLTFSVVANSKHEAEKVAKFLNNSKRVANLIKDSREVSTTLKRLPADNEFASLPDFVRGHSQTDEERDERLSALSAMVAVTEDEFEIEVPEGDNIDERVARVEKMAVERPPAPDSSYWKIADAFGAFCGGMAKSFGGG